jgi:hypothetical protein
MQVLSLIWGILAIVGMVVGFFPCLGALNWINIPFSGLGIIISGIALGTAGDNPPDSPSKKLKDLVGPVVTG